jgi:hypothetical protein
LCFAAAFDLLVLSAQEVPLVRIAASVDSTSPARDHQADGLHTEAARDKCQRLRRRALVPVLVVREAEQRRFFGHLVDDAQRRKPD